MQFTCESQITDVTVYARGALVQRRVATPARLPDGDVDLIVPGVTALAEGGSVRMPPQKTFWADLFGMLADRYGTPWMVGGGMQAA